MSTKNYIEGRAEGDFKALAWWKEGAKDRRRGNTVWEGTMEDHGKTKEQLIHELTKLRQLVEGSRN